MQVGSSSGVLFLCDTLKLQTMFKLRLHAAALWDISVDSLRVVTGTLSRMLTYAHVCSRTLHAAALGDISVDSLRIVTGIRMLTYAGVCWRMLAHADVC